MADFGLDVPVQRRAIPDRALTLYLRALPPSANNLYVNIAGRGRARSSAYETWLRAAALCLRVQVKGRLTGRVDIILRLEDSHPGRDVSNCIKPLEDLLVKTGVLADDRARFVRSVRAEWADVKGVEIHIRRCS